MSDADDAAITTQVKFRPSRKRKALRQRSPDPDVADDDAPAPSRLRKPVRRVGVGVGFTTDEPSAAEVPLDDDKAPLVQGIPDRFMRQTGLVTTLDDRHMTEYIESRLRSRAPQPGQEPTPVRLPGDRLAEQPAQRGKLYEVAVSADRPHSHQDRVKPSKAPIRRSRRASNDMKRDQLVDAFLSENKHVYDVSSHPDPTDPDDDRTVDDRMADDFRRRYFSEVAARRQKRRPVQPAKQQQLPKKDVLKGPKLGGSRNQRAAVRNILLQQEKEKGRSF